MKDNKGSRIKRGLTIINLIETPQGYSIVEGTELLNKPPKEVSVNASQPQSTILSAPYQPPVLSKQQPKLSTKQNSLFFVKWPTDFSVLNNPDKECIQKQPFECKYADWFDLNKISDLQENQIKFWEDGDNLQDNSELLDKYFKYRNLIIEKYNEEFAPKNLYMSASAIRKFICDNAQLLMRIHVFLTTWGIINSSKINFENQNLGISNLFFKKQSEGKYDVLKLKSAYYQQGKKRPVLDEEVQNYYLLKKVTDNVRPFCDFCGIHCEMVWFQHIRSIDPKQISTIMKNVNSKNPPLSQKDYEIVLCTKCYCDGSFPLLLTHHDFKKVELNDKLEPGKKKKSSKNKKKEKKRKQKEKQILQEYEEEKYEGEEEEIACSKKEPKRDNEKQQDEEYEEQKEAYNLAQKEKEEDLQKKSTINGAKQIKQAESGVEVQKQKQVLSVDDIIKQIVKNVKKDRIWSFLETKKLLQLVEQHGDNWNLIEKNLKSNGLCTDCQPEDIISYFLELPLRNVSELIEQNSNECFVRENKNFFKSRFLSKKIQKNFDNSVQLSQQLKTHPIVYPPKNQKYQELLDNMVKIHIRKVEQKTKILTNLQMKALFEQRKYEEATKQIYGE